MHNKNALNHLCPRTTIQIIQELNGLFLIPKYSYIIYNIQALASCTTSVYVNLSKNSFFLCYHPKKSAKADAKVHTFLIPPKFFGNFFSKNMKVFGIIDKRKGLYLIKYIKHRPLGQLFLSTTTLFYPEYGANK